MEEAFRCECHALYGLTETSPVLTYAHSKPELGWTGEQRSSGQALAGFAVPGTTIKIVDLDDHFVAEDGVAVGEVVARGDSIMEGYWGEPAMTAEAMRGGWFHTGDMGSIDADGYLRLVDRKKDIIISGGENVSSLEVEYTLLAHPAVLEAAVIPMADKRWGEVPRALVVLKPGHTATEAELIAFARGRAAHYKCPHSIILLDSLPKTGTGKVLKKLLRAQYA